MTVDQACDEFLVDAEARKLREATLEKYRLLFDGPKNPKKKSAEETKPRSPGLKEFARTQGIRFLQELELSQLRKFRALWRDGNFAALKKLERLRAFFGFAQESGWTANNPAKRIKSPTVTQPPTMPFTREQMVDIFAACEKYKDNYGRTGQSNGRRLRNLRPGAPIQRIANSGRGHVAKIADRERAAIPLHSQNRNPGFLPAPGLCGRCPRFLPLRQRNLFLLERPISTQERRRGLAT